MKLKHFLLFCLILSQTFGMGRNPLVNRGFFDRYFGRPDTNYSLFINNNGHQAEQLLSSPQDLAELQNLCGKKKFPILSVYLELENYPLFKNELNNFLQIMAKHNIKTYYVIQPDYTTANANAKIQSIADFVSFNSTLENGFAGLHINYDPSANYSSTDVSLLNNELSFLEKINLLRRKTKLQLSALLPDHFALPEFSEKYLPKFFNYLNTVIIYRPQINSEEDNSLLAYAEEIKTEFLISPATDISLSQTDHYNVLKEYLELVVGLQKKYKMFNSIALNYEDFKILSASQP